MLTKSSKYSIRAVLFLASKEKTDRFSAKEIAEILKIPAPFLAKTLQELVRKTIISSIKGPNGGFFLTDKDREKSIFDIIKCTDDINKFDNCFLGQNECNDENPCVVHHLYSPFKVKLIKKLKTKTITEMSEEYLRDNKSLKKIWM